MYGTGTYGDSPYGGTSFDTTGPTLVSISPSNGATIISTADPVIFTITDPAEFNQWSLAVSVDTPVISGGGFLPGHSGTITFNGTELDVSITSPGWTAGAHAISISITDLAGVAQTFTSAFTLASDTVTVSDSVAIHGSGTSAFTDTVTISDSVGLSLHTHLPISETVPLVETPGISAHLLLPISAPGDRISVHDAVASGVISVVSDGPLLTISWPIGMRIEGITKLSNYSVFPLGPGDHPLGNGAFPVGLEGAAPVQNVLQTGSACTIVSTDGSSSTLSFADSVPLSSANIGEYISLASPSNTIDYLRIVSVPSSTTVVVDHPLVAPDPAGAISWSHKTPIMGVQLTMTKPTNGGLYRVLASGLKTSIGDEDFSLSDFFTAFADFPSVVGATYLGDGQILVTFSDPMLNNDILTDPREYSFSLAPTAVTITSVRTISETQVLLETLGMGSGTYQLEVNASGTPHDFAGNPIDPLFNDAIFTGDVPETVRSIFVDHGPITKPPLVLQSGGTATVVDAITLTLPGATISPSMIGLSITLTGTAANGGTYIIKSVVSSTKVTVNASLHLPDPSNGSIGWSLFDPRDGEIADDPTDVVVRLNGVPTAAQSVIGLLGQIVMSSVPTHGTDVQVDYHWVCNPTIDFRRMNSKEFRFNNWNRDLGRPTDPSRHKYRFNNTMVRPSSFVPLDLRAVIDQPLLRDLKYRAYERAYTAVFNDPNLMLFNSPINHIAFPPLEKITNSSFINYEATILPELDGTAPWTRNGSGTATINVDVLVVQDTSSGPFPSGNPIFWSRSIDLTFPHVFAIAWRMTLDADPVTEGVFTGVAAGYSDDSRAIVVGYLNDGGVRKIGILKAGSGNDPSVIAAWGGGLDSQGNPTGLPVAIDTSILHSYRIFRDRDGTIRVYLDGSVVETLRITEAELPFLEELNAPFNEIQGAFFGSLSRQAANTSTWSFVRYTILPLNPFESAPSVFVSYEGTTPPESASQPWTPVGFHGTETIVSNNFLLLDSTSATDASTEVLAGLVSGDFRGYTRIEPLLQAAADVVLDVNLTLRTYTHGITPNAVMAAVDDGQFLLQLCFFPDKAAPKFSYGGRSLPDQFSPYFWSQVGGVVPTMVGQYLHIVDATTTDGVVYFVDDNSPPVSPGRVVSSANDYILEFRVQVLAHAADVGGFAGVMAQVYDSTKSVGAMLQDVAGTKFVTLHSDGVPVVGGQFAFNWDDGAFHTYRIVKNTLGSLVTLFIDGAFIGSVAYGTFVTPPASVVGVISFGSSTPSSVQATSTTNWAYCNCWRVVSARQYVGIWKGSDPNSLTGYHLPLKGTGRQATVAGNALGDGNANFIAQGVVIGDQIIVDSGPNKGVYTIASVVGPNTLTIVGTWPQGPSTIDYRIPSQIDWTVPHRYRLVRDPGGGVTLLLDLNPTPLIRIQYDGVHLPPSAVGIPTILAGGLPSISWGAFDPTNLSQTSWDYVRFGITRPVSELGIVPPHQVLNQRNVMASFEHHLTNIPHSHTDFWSESEGIPPQTDPDFLKNPGLTAYTLLNEGTPLVPSTQTFEVRHPTPVVVSLVGFNKPEDVLNDQSFLMNSAEQEVKLLVPDDILYDSLQVIESDTGEPNLIAPFSDECEPHDMFGTLSFQNTVCLTYTGDVLPELDTSAPTPWALQSDNPAHAFATAFAGILTYGTDGTGTRTVYRNVTPLPDQISLQTEVKFKLKLLVDSSGGLGDTQVRFGWSSPGLTMALAFVTTPTGQRYVFVVDLNNQAIVGGIPFDFSDGAFHTYRLVRDVQTASVQVFIDS